MRTGGRMLSYILSIWALSSTIAWFASVLTISYVAGTVDPSIKLSDYKSKALEYLVLYKDEYIDRLPPRSARMLRRAQYVYKVSGVSLILCFFSAFVVKKLS